MLPPLATVLILLLAAVVLFILNKPRMDVVGLLAIVTLTLTGIVTPGEALAGFSDPNIVLIAALFVVGEGLVRTGVAKRLGDLLVTRAGNSETRLIILLMLAVALLGATMSSTGVVAIFIPVVLRIARRIRVSPGRLMMPLSFSGLISGMLTLVATAPNLIVHGDLTRSGHRGFSFFSFTPFGLPILLLGIGYMLIARRWLPKGTSDDAAALRKPTISEFTDRYQLKDRQFLIKVTSTSPLIGITLGEALLRTRFNATVVAIERKTRSGNTLLSPTPRTLIENGDILLMETFDARVDRENLAAQLKLEPIPTQNLFFKEHAHEVGMAEVLLPPESRLIGQSVVEAGFRTRFGTTMVGLRRNLQTISKAFVDEKLQPGDTLLLIGPWKSIRTLHANPHDFVVLNLPAELDEIPPAAHRSRHALLSLGLMVALMISGLVPNVIAALIACLLMGAFRCITLESAYRSIHWQSLVLIVGMLPFATALDRTGGIALAAQALSHLTGNAGPHALLACIFILTVAIGLFVSNTATAVLMAPVAIAAARDLGISPYPFAMAVALAASTAFITPVSSPVNILVVEPGRYRFADFVKIGLPFTLIVLLASLLLIPLVLPF